MNKYVNGAVSDYSSITTKIQPFRYFKGAFI